MSLLNFKSALTFYTGVDRSNGCLKTEKCPGKSSSASTPGQAVMAFCTNLHIPHRLTCNK